MNGKIIPFPTDRIRVQAESADRLAIEFSGEALSICRKWMAEDGIDLKTLFARMTGSYQLIRTTQRAGRKIFEEGEGGVVHPILPYTYS